MSEECQPLWSLITTLIISVATLLINAYQTFYFERKKKLATARRNAQNQILDAIHDKTVLTKDSVLELFKEFSEFKTSSTQ